MLICPLCSDVTVRTLSQLMTHIRLVHADDPHFIIQCSFQGCTRTFRTFTVYRNHVYTCHDTTVLDTPGLSLTEDMDNPCKFVNRITAVAQPTSYRVITLDNIFIV